MSWHKVTLPFQECGVYGLGSLLTNTFGRILISHGGQHFDAALFAQTSDDNESVCFYFSPAAVKLAPLLVKQFRGVQCDGPPFRGQLVALEVGDERSWDLLGVNKPAGIA